MAFVSNGVTMFNAGALVANAGNQIFISSQTASNSASVSFTSGLTSTYKAYKFVFSNIHPRNTNARFKFNMSTDGGSNYNVTKTTTYFYSYHNEADTDTGLTYDTGEDLAQSTSDQTLMANIYSNADESGVGSLLLFNPASTTYVKHFIATIEHMSVTYVKNNYVAGYANTTSAVNALIFKMDSGNFDGTIYLYGIKT